MTNEAAFFTGRSKYFCAGSKSASGFSFLGRRFVQGFGRTSFGQKRADLHQDAACPIRSGAILADTPKGITRQIFDKFRRAGRYKLLAEVGILRKFRKVSRRMISSFTSRQSSRGLSPALMNQDFFAARPCCPGLAARRFAVPGVSAARTAAR